MLRRNFLHLKASAIKGNCITENMSESDRNVPYYLTKKFLERVLKNNIDYEQGKLSIMNHTIDTPISKGNNYTSTILIIDIVYKITAKDNSESIRNISLLGKVPVEEGVVAVIRKAKVFEKEFNAYKDLMPKMVNIMRSETENTDLIPKFFKTDTDAILILENLTPMGYKMASRSEQLDYEHCVLTLKSIAKFHAASVKLHEEEPELVETFGTDLLFKKPLNEDVKCILEPMFGEEHLEMVCREFEKWPETSKFVDFLTKLKPKLWDIFLDLAHAKDGEFTALIHADLWTSNLLYKYDHQSKPETMKFIDYQITRYSNPAVDVLHFLYTSVRYEVLKAHFHDFTNLYLETLNLYLEKYGSSKRLANEDFKHSLEIREIFCLIQCVNILSYCFAEYDDPCDMIDENKPPAEIPYERLIQNKKFISVCAKFFEDFSKKEWYQNFQ